MISKFWMLAFTFSILAGCADNSPPPPRADVPPPGVKNYPPRDAEPVKPLPDQGPLNTVSPRKPEATLPTQPIPEAESFVDAYNKVGRPRIAVILNRTLDGKTIPPTTGDTAPAAVYLRQGQYDESQAGNLNYDAMENAIADWLACNSRVTIVTGTVARMKLSEQQLNDLNKGLPELRQPLGELLDVDVLVHLQAYPIQQSTTGLKVRLVGQVLNTKGGESLGRPSVDLMLPGDSQEIVRSARTLVRMLMNGMIEGWYVKQPTTVPAIQQ